MVNGWILVMMKVEDQDKDQDKDPPPGPSIVLDGRGANERIRFQPDRIYITGSITLDDIGYIVERVLRD